MAKFGLFATNGQNDKPLQEFEGTNMFVTSNGEAVSVSAPDGSGGTMQTAVIRLSPGLYLKKIG
jgi:hypothetical protein